jgi:hypothetical protein
MARSYNKKRDDNKRKSIFKQITQKLYKIIKGYFGGISRTTIKTAIITLWIILLIYGTAVVIMESPISNVPKIQNNNTIEILEKKQNSNYEIGICY